MVGNGPENSQVALVRNRIGGLSPGFGQDGALVGVMQWTWDLMSGLYDIVEC